MISSETGGLPGNFCREMNVQKCLYAFLCQNIVTTQQDLSTLRHPPSLVPSSIRPCMIEGPRSIRGPLQGRGMIFALKLPHSFACEERNPSSEGFLLFKCEYLSSYFYSYVCIQEADGAELYFQV